MTTEISASAAARIATYRTFLADKSQLATASGLDVDPRDVHPALMPHQRDAVAWAVQGGRRAIFAAFGLGKSLMQLEAERLVLDSRGGGRGLIVCPLGVRQEFARDAQLIGLETTFIRSDAEALWDGIYITNYESVRDGKLDPRGFDVVSLDEAAILRGFGGTKTFRQLMALYEGSAAYRFVATATPSPNEYIELLSYAAFLDIMDVGQAKTRFFKRDSAHADRLTLHPHMEEEFWHWVASWALFLQKPSDLGYSDEGYELPPLDVRWHEVPAAAGAETGGTHRDGQGYMFADASLGVTEAAAVKRESLAARMVATAEIVAADPEDHFLLWHDLEAERHVIEDTFPVTVYGRWLEFKDGNSAALELYERHYSAYQYADGRERHLFVGPGEKTVLLTRERDALFAWRKFRDDSGQQGICCAVFRNEGAYLSSELIREAMAIAWLRWPGERLYTYVNPGEIESPNPGYCFKAAGWTTAGQTKGGLAVLEALPGADVPDVEARPALRTVWGAQDLDEREHRIADFSDGRIQILATKPVLAGSGCNFQRFCHRAVFTGIGFKFADFVQAIHRIQRFLQTEPVRIDIIYAEAERSIRERLEQKWKQHDELVARMGEIIREYGLARDAMAGLHRQVGVPRQEVTGPGYRLVNNDAVEEAIGVPDNSIDLIVTSIPFSTQYEYTPSYNDFGHSADNDHFWAQMDYLTPELFRALAPGRVACIHVKDRIAPGGLTGLGFQTLQPFHAEAIQHYMRHGFALLAMITVVTDVVRENNQTYRLGWTEQCKDGSKMGSGVPEYVLVFRKPPTDNSDGYADVPVVKSKDGYSRARWQTDAHGYWRSSGDRPLLPEELSTLPAQQVFRRFRDHYLASVYAYAEHIAVGEHLDKGGRLPSGFMLLQPPSHHPDVWTDVARMRTLNMLQERKGQQQHLCPLQFDIVDRLIARYSNEGDTVADPFGGLMTVPYCAVKAGRYGIGWELNARYFADGTAYVASAAAEASAPTLFDLLTEEQEAS